MRYLMFAQTTDNQEFCQIVHASDDDTAIVRMESWLRRWHRVDAFDILCIAGVWDKDSKFYSATQLSDLEM